MHAEHGLPLLLSIAVVQVVREPALPQDKLDLARQQASLAFQALLGATAGRQLAAGWHSLCPICLRRHPLRAPVSPLSLQLWFSGNPLSLLSSPIHALPTDSQRAGAPQRQPLGHPWARACKADLRQGLGVRSGPNAGAGED